jgi:hypothetical protein
VSLAFRSRSNVRALVHAVHAVAAGAVAAALAVTVDACTSATTTLPYTPITGIIVRSQSLVAGFGCGTNDDQVYRYAAVLTYAPLDAGADATTSDGGTGPLVLTNVFDCFTDGVFENLPVLNGYEDFKLAIYAYSRSAYVGAGLPPNLGCAPMQQADAAPCAASTRPLTATQLRAATWTSTCDATQQAGTPVLAVCTPLELSGSASADASVETGADASPDAALDGAGAADAPAESSVGGDADTDADAGPLDGAVPDAGAGPDAADSSPGDATPNDG